MNAKRRGLQDVAGILTLPGAFRGRVGALQAF